MKSEGKNEIISISLKPDVLGSLDILTRELGLSGRSETIRMGLRTLEAENKERKKLKGKINAVFTIVHKHSASVAKIAHKYQKSVTSHLHNHFEKEICVDVFILDGEARMVKDFVESAQKIKGLGQTKLVVVG